jgi:hypothetical protein
VIFPVFPVLPDNIDTNDIIRLYIDTSDTPDSIQISEIFANRIYTSTILTDSV